MTDTDPDPRGLIRESYNIEGITPEECRSIFLDWAISAPDGAVAPTIRTLLERHGGTAPGHPMTAILTDALENPPSARRRGGRRGRSEA
ncbi:hypothetical protein EF888_12465 [Silicimonas algicola]|uniref:Uncharacterized protein n=1 Tax=Silicimonas algicola TaxID=1826607 RepID=A0A316GAP7_9RHOB|nr:hypothetical protein [Silicimonas algicola]AZQ67877.1 hypothetical protein EF888_12465 [Silicimonas algicola]PWK57692.1 hypothetical protein C8D95_102339 [Silicimonas algicola]